MPTYVYEREDGSRFEIMQSIREPALEICPETGQPVRRIIAGGQHFDLRGGGWYRKEYGRYSKK